MPKGQDSRLNELETWRRIKKVQKMSGICEDIKKGLKILSRLAVTQTNAITKTHLMRICQCIKHNKLWEQPDIKIYITCIDLHIQEIFKKICSVAVIQPLSPFVGENPVLSSMLYYSEEYHHSARLYSSFYLIQITFLKTPYLLSFTSET